MGAHGRTWVTLLGLVALLALAGCGSASVKAPVETRNAVARTVGGDTYSVRRGDTLAAIALRHGLDFRQLAAWNGIGSPYRIAPGQRLRLTQPEVAPRAARERVARAGNPPRPAAAAPPAPAAAKPAPAKPRPQAKLPPQAKPRPPATTPARGAQRVAWAWPTKGRVLRRFTEGGNKGVDIGGRLGTPVRAAAAGRVVYSGSGLVGYGKLIILKHNNSYLSAYAHNDRILVNEGDSVVGGQRIAHMGQTGTQEVKLHFEIRRDGKPVDPLKYLPARSPRQEDSDA